MTTAQYSCDVALPDTFLLVFRPNEMSRQKGI